MADNTMIAIKPHHGSQGKSPFVLATSRPYGRRSEEELVEDMISIVTSFSVRLYGKRGGRVAKKLSDILAEAEVTTGEDHGDGCDS